MILRIIRKDFTPTLYRTSILIIFTVFFLFFLIFFFFSSRRRHTRCSRDWSSDVCSSDLFSTISTPSGACSRRCWLAVRPSSSRRWPTSRREVSDPWSASGSPSTPNSISWRRIQTSWRCSHKPAGPRRGHLLPPSSGWWCSWPRGRAAVRYATTSTRTTSRDRKSTRLNSSHGYISYAVFCLKKKKKSATDSEEDHVRHTEQS